LENELITEQYLLENKLDRSEYELARAKKSELLALKCLRDAIAPGVLFGKLRVRSDESWDGDLNCLGSEHPWRLVLDCGATWNGLTDWSTDKIPLSRALMPRAGSGIHILGAVIGWIRAPHSDVEL
jgi:hypothetical protein